MEPDGREQALLAVSDALLTLRRLERVSGPGNGAACEVTPAQGILVREVVLAGERGSTGGELALRLGISASAVTQLVDGLVEAGILSRSSDPDDHRRTRIALTDHGATLYALFDQARLAQAEALFQNLDDDEVRTLAELLSKATTEPEASRTRKMGTPSKSR